ncbi:lipoprotein N-acyltransferase Lnb domain-containing protein [Marinifilum flexuosum]|uniref:Uncharacterized protein DUF4105 n=1 Tax=Marinifilum flexuosum TaxID=1117708 RepID=A0A419X3L8_9BACT|nr:DUF4105 domain-containing protein [Marinifilum flexuosum]RKE02297.1 uncharacterized protein DUF4105 [Marinifilum flexuosum]
MKRFKFLASLILIGILSFSNTYAKQFSEQSEVSLLTCSPGEDIYRHWGHSALRFHDPLNKIDLVFNYGTFNFNTPNFYTKFIKGKLMYRLAYESYRDFLPEYMRSGQGVTEQKLNLDLETKRKLFAAVIENYKPENRYYHYDFLFDNCSTRIRDIIEDNVEGKIIYKENTNESKSFWNLLDQFMERSRWVYLGIHLILGSPCDVEATPYQYMFLPDNMMFAFTNATVLNNGERVPLVSHTKEVLKPTLDYKMTEWYKRPSFIFGVLSLIFLLISIRSLKSKRNYFIIDHILFGVTGLVGWVIIFLWFFTDHQATGPNWNIIWALPFYFPVANILLSMKNKASYFFFFASSLLLLIVLSAWSIIPQSLPNEILPIVALLFIRSIYIVKKLKLKLI